MSEANAELVLKISNEVIGEFKQQLKADLEKLKPALVKDVGPDGLAKAAILQAKIEILDLLVWKVNRKIEEAGHKIKIEIKGQGICSDCKQKFQGEPFQVHLELKKHQKETGHDVYGDALHDSIVKAIGEDFVDAVVES